MPNGGGFIRGLFSGLYIGIIEDLVDIVFFLAPRLFDFYVRAHTEHLPRVGRIGVRQTVFATIVAFLFYHLVDYLFWGLISKCFSLDLMKDPMPA